MIKIDEDNLHIIESLARGMSPAQMIHLMAAMSIFRSVQENKARVVHHSLEAMVRGLNPAEIFEIAEEVEKLLKISMACHFEESGLDKDFDPEQYIRENS